MGIVSLLISRPPPPPPKNAAPIKKARKKERTYASSGWTYYESSAAALKRFARPRRQLHGASWQMVVECAASVDKENTSEITGGASSVTPSTRAWPLLPPVDFAQRLANKSWARPIDRQRVADLYRKQCASQLGGLASLSLTPESGLTLGQGEAALLGQCIELCPRLAELRLVELPSFGDAALTALCEALAASAAPVGALTNRLTHLSLDGNALTDKGAKAIAKAVGKGALRTLRSLSLARNKLGAPGVTAIAAASRKPNCLSRLTELNLYANQIGAVEGWDALGDELRAGGLRTLTSLYLGGNGLGPEGCVALAKACLPGLTQCPASIPSSPRPH